MSCLDLSMTLFFFFLGGGGGGVIVSFFNWTTAKQTMCTIMKELLWKIGACTEYLSWNIQIAVLWFCSGYHLSWHMHMINTLRPRQNESHFADDIFKCIFLNENAGIPITISLKFVPQGPINNIPALVQKMAWRRPGDKPLSGPMMVRLPTNICVIQPQWVNLLAPGTFEWNFRYIIFKLNLAIYGSNILFDIALGWMSLDPTDDKSALVWVMAWCHQATSHYLSQSRPRFVSPYGFTRPQWLIYPYSSGLLYWHWGNGMCMLPSTTLPGPPFTNMV